MRILHLSHEALPDWRIEKSAISASNREHEVIFAGSKISPFYKRKVFSKIFEVNWTAKARYGIPYYWNSVKKQVESILKESRPDIIHAHNIFSAKMIKEFNMPFIYDDHEYWSKHSQLLIEIEKYSEVDSNRTSINKLFQIPIRIRRRIINGRIIQLWTNWEKEIVGSNPTITVSNKIADDLRKINSFKNDIFVVPNFPMKHETESFETPKFNDTLSSVYAGSDGHNIAKLPNRNIDGLPELFDNQDLGELFIIGWEGKSSSKVNYIGYLDRNLMFKEMSKHSIGLLPWKRHWSHEFTSPNKAYEYAHSGLIVILTSSFKPVIEILGKNCVTFDGHKDLISKIEYLKEDMNELYKKRIDIFNYARSNLLWENNENNIFEAYKKC